MILHNKFSGLPKPVDIFLASLEGFLSTGVPRVLQGALSPWGPRYKVPYMQY